MDYSNVFTILKTKVWEFTQEFLVIALLVAIVSIFFVQAFKITDEKVFTKKKASNIFMWFLNLIVNIVISVIIVLVFDGKEKWYFTLLYIVIISVFSWALSLFCYHFLFKFVFDYIEILSLKTDVVKKDIQKQKENI